MPFFSNNFVILVSIFAIWSDLAYSGISSGISLMSATIILSDLISSWIKSGNKNLSRKVLFRSSYDFIGGSVARVLVLLKFSFFGISKSVLKSKG